MGILAYGHGYEEKGISISIWIFWWVNWVRVRVSRWMDGMFVR